MHSTKKTHIISGVTNRSLSMHVNKIPRPTISIESDEDEEESESEDSDLLIEEDISEEDDEYLSVTKPKNTGSVKAIPETKVVA